MKTKSNNNYLLKNQPNQNPQSQKISLKDAHLLQSVKQADHVFRGKFAHLSAYNTQEEE